MAISDEAWAAILGELHTSLHPALEVRAASGQSALTLLRRLALRPTRPSRACAHPGPSHEVSEYLEHGYVPSGDGADEGSIEAIRRQAAVFAIVDAEPALRRRAYALASGYIQILLDAIVHAPRQDVPMLALYSRCCGTVKPHVRELCSGWGLRGSASTRSRPS